MRNLFQSNRRRRGYALIVALALILGLTVVVTTTQRQVVQALAITKTQRDYERALQMAEAGANAYINLLVSNPPPNGTTNGGYIPQVTVLNSILTAQQFKDQVRAGTIPQDRVIYYPAGQTAQGYVATQVGNTTAQVTIVSYGFSHGVVRRVKVGASNFSIWEWAALYGIDPIQSNQDFAIKATNNTNVVGTMGAEGLIQISQGEPFTLYDGPQIQANGSYGAPFNNADRPIYQSLPNLPKNHVGTGTIANPTHKHYARSLRIETADEAANLISGTTQGVEYFRSNNNNATGLRLLVKHKTTNVVRELPGNYSLVPTTGNNAYQLVWPNSATYTTNGMTANENPLGLRVYPGHYYFTSVVMGNSDVMWQRTYNDADRSGFTSGQRGILIQGDPANPNPGQAENRNIRFFLGHGSQQNPLNDPNSTFTWQTKMEYPIWGSRFRIYSASRGNNTIKGSGSSTISYDAFRAAILAYNKDQFGYYGSVQFQSSTYLYGSLLGWQVTIGGATTIEKQVEDAGMDKSDKLTFSVTDWSELQ